MFIPEVFQKFFEANLPENNFAHRRINWDDYFLLVAATLALRSTCRRRKYGAVIVNEDYKIVSSGYNGAPVDEPHCIDGVCWREEHKIPHGEQYEKCVAVHAEQNALISGDPQEMYGADIYIVGYDCTEHTFIPGIPCGICSPMLHNAGIENYITRERGLDGELIVCAP